MIPSPTNKAENQESKVPLERVTKVEAKPNNTLQFTVDDQSARRVDLTGLIAKSRHFAVFATDKEAFKRVRTDEYGAGVEWENGLDLSVDTLIAMADEQRPMTGKQLADCILQLEINLPETARILDTSERTVRTYMKMNHVPNTTAYTIRRCVEDNTFFMALYRPIPVAPRGRPKAAP